MRRSAVNIPVRELKDRLAELGPDGSRPIIVYCRSGLRSTKAARILRRAGFLSVHDLGAMAHW